MCSGACDEGLPWGFPLAQTTKHNHNNVMINYLLVDQ